MIRLLTNLINNQFRFNGKKKYLELSFLILLVAIGIFFMPWNYEKTFGVDVKNSGVKVKSIGRMKVIELSIQPSGMDKAIEVRAVVTEEKFFRSDQFLSDYFSEKGAETKSPVGVIWKSEVSPSEKLDSYVGMFSTFNEECGVIINRLHSYRVYRKYQNQFEIDYSFDADSNARAVVSPFVKEIDRLVVVKLIDLGVF